uniref:Carboxylic ester hydrolase n=1 Tax=Clastoptera arizonana TaxID=38151 RepID=A0A1B6E0H5_9HEMI
MQFKVLTLILLSVVINHTFVFGKDSFPEVTIEQGVLRGIYEKTYTGRKFAAFRGIPYAQPPVGKQRFKEPKAPNQWSSVYQATEDGPPCLQYTHFDYTIVGDEDCLYLNVFTPSVPHGKEKNDLFDVIVYIHGGAFMFGNGVLYGPRILLDRDVIFITVNYRLGPLGFLSTGDAVIPGNNGLKDQSAALRWIQKNINAFGGNRDSVTIMGLSAGGASVHYHYMSPLSQGLFKRGISFSGTALCPWTQMEQGKEKAFQIGANLGCNTQNSTLLLSCLRDRPARKIVSQVKEFLGWLYNPYSAFGPTVEKGGKTPFLSQDPYEILAIGNFQQIPWITSVTSEEGLYPGAEMITKKYLKELDEKFNEIIPHLLDFNHTIKPELKQEVCMKIKEYYLKNKDVSQNTVQFIQMIGDRLFVSCAEEGAKMQAKKSTAPVYFYYFNFRSTNKPNLFLQTDNKDYLGVSHGDDNLYFLSHPHYLNPGSTEQEKEMMQKFLDFITSYAKTGIPKFKDDFLFPSVKEMLPQLLYVHIKSPSDISQQLTKSLGHSNFWFKLPLQEKVNTARLASLDKKKLRNRSETVGHEEL